MILADKQAYGAAEVSFGSGERPKYPALAKGINGFYQDMLRPLDELEAAVFAALPTLPSVKAQAPFRYTAIAHDVIDEALSLFLKEMAGPDRSRAGFVNGGLESDTPDGVIQQREVLTYAIGLQRGAELANRGVTLSAGRDSPSVRAMLDNAFSRLSTKGTFTLEPIRDDVHAVLTSAQAAGLSPLETARQLQKLFDAQRGYNFQRLARTEAAAAAIEGSRNQMADLGVRYVKWLLASSACPICQSFEGKLFSIEDTANHPPYASHPNCLVGGQEVWGPKPLASAARWYAGEVVEIETGAGYKLTVTPNHPILTPQGWIAAGLLKKGDQVVCNRRPERMDPAIYPDDYQIPALIEDVAAALGGALTVASLTVPVAPEDFHGDGKGSEVCIIRSNGRLRGHFTLPLGQPLVQQNFERGNPQAALLTDESAATQFLEATFLAPYRRVSGVRVKLSLLGGKTARVEALDLTHAAFGDLVGMEPFADGQSADAEMLRQINLRLPGEIKPDHLRIVRRVPFAGHVYNLQTEPGYYTANCIITHNCACDLVPA